MPMPPRADAVCLRHEPAQMRAARRVAFRHAALRFRHAIFRRASLMPFSPCELCRYFLAVFFAYVARMRDAAARLCCLPSAAS